MVDVYSVKNGRKLKQYEKPINCNNQLKKYYANKHNREMVEDQNKWNELLSKIIQNT